MRSSASRYVQLSLARREVRADHPLGVIRAMVDQALNNISGRFDRMCSKTGRPSIAPEKLLRAQLLQMLYSIRSERLLVEEIDYSMLFRSFVGMECGRAGVKRDRVHEEPEPPAGGRCGAGVPGLA